MTDPGAGHALRLTLPPRLRMIAAMVPRCELAADIGADHGRLSAALLLEGTCRRMLVCDRSVPSLSKARELFRLCGLEDRASFLVGDGLEACASRAPDAVIVAGMGAGTICGILERGEAMLQRAHCILSPMLGAEDLRRFLGANGYAVEEESLVRSAGRWALGIRARKSGACTRYTREQCLLGPWLIERPNDEMIAWTRWRIEVLASMERSLAVSQNQERLARVRKDLSILRGFLERTGSQ